MASSFAPVIDEAGYLTNRPVEEAEYPLAVEYCSQCTFPIEFCKYCPYGSDCKCHAEALSKEVGGLSLEDADAGGDDDGRKRQKRGGKSAAKAASKNKKEPARPQNIEIFTAPRGKKKYVTVVVGLGRNGIDVKLAAKAFGTKFASGSSVSGDDEIVIQGDVRDVLFDFIPDKWPQITEDMIDDCGEQKRH